MTSTGSRYRPSAGNIDVGTQHVVEVEQVDMVMAIACSFFAGVIAR
jgi:hypothetical protein